MPKQEKIFTVANLAEKLKAAKAVVLTDYLGLTVAQMQALRAKIKASGGEFTVSKNTLLSRAAQQAGLNLEALAGPTAILFAYEDEIAALKSLVDFAAQTGLPRVKFALMGKDPISVEKVNQLAALPSRQALFGQLLAVLTAPSAGLVHALSWNNRRLVESLVELKNKKT